MCISYLVNTFSLYERASHPSAHFNGNKWRGGFVLRRSRTSQQDKWDEPLMELNELEKFLPTALQGPDHSAHWSGHHFFGLRGGTKTSLMAWMIFRRKFNAGLKIILLHSVTFISPWDLFELKTNCQNFEMSSDHAVRFAHIFLFCFGNKKGFLFGFLQYSSFCTDVHVN